MRAAAYARYSTDKQSEISVESQLEVIQEYCRRKGYEIVSTYIDRAQSGYYDSRENFQKMIEDAKKKKFDVIIVYNYSRFARKAADALLYASMLEEKIGVKIESATEPFENNAAGNFARTVLFAAAQLQRDIAAEDTLMKLRSLAKRGYWTGGPPPYGYDRIKVIDEDGRPRSKLTINEKEAKIVREIFDLFLKGSSMKEIAKLLNSKGIKTRKGKNWDTNYIAHILRNEKYTGKLIYGKGTKKNHRIQREDMIIVPGAIPAIIPEKIFLQVQKKLLLLPKYHTKNAYPYLLSGIAYCQHGHKMIGYKKRAPYYYCKKCGYLINAKKAENFVINYIKHIVLTNIDFEKLAREINAQLQEQFLQENAHQSYLMEEKEKLQKELDRIIDAIKAGGHIKTLTEEAIKIENQLDQINAKLSKSKKVLKKITPEQLKEKWEKIKTALLDSDPLAKKEVIHEIVDRVILYKDGFVEVRMRGM